MKTKQDSQDFYNKLLEFDQDSKKVKNITYVKDLLYKFSYCNLKDVFTDPMLIRKSVINYLYTGLFKLTDSQDISDNAKQCLSKILNYMDNDTLIQLNQKLYTINQQYEACPNPKKKRYYRNWKK
ncbi:MAG: hypothetical protein FJX80_04880 [Bacteroidetes bacterium]|nr:hypothetical protein [Bacteroidota bacterium]